MDSSDEETGEDVQRIIMAGLDLTGKTIILYKLKLGQNVASFPTVGFNVETVDYHGMKFSIWDMGGTDKMRPLWKHYLHTDVAGVIWVVDSADRTRISQSRQELHKLMNAEELKGVDLLVFANKQDLPNAMNENEIIQELALNAFTGNWKWQVQPSTATTGVGLIEGLKWLQEQANAKMKA